MIQNILKEIHFIKNFNGFMLAELDMNHIIPCKEAMMAPLVFSLLASNAMFSFIRDKFLLIKILVLLPSWCFSLSRLDNFFWLSKALLQYFL